MAGMLGGRVVAGLFRAAISARAGLAALAAVLAGPAAFQGGVPAARAQPPGGTATAAMSVVSADGLLVLVAQVEPPCLVVLHARRGVPVHTIVPAARDGRIATRIAALRTAALRRSFIVAPADLAELWEISYDPKAEDLYDGLVHDYRFGEGVPRRGYLGLRRTSLPEPLVDFVLDEHEAEAWGLAPPPPAGTGEGQVINLDVRRRVAVVPAPRMQAHMQALVQALTPARMRPPGQGQPPAEADAPAPAAEAEADLARRQTASRPWPCTEPKVPGP